AAACRAEDVNEHQPRVQRDQRAMLRQRKLHGLHPLPVWPGILILNAEQHLFAWLHKGVKGLPVAAAQDLDAAHCRRHCVRHLSMRSVTKPTGPHAPHNLGSGCPPLYGLSANGTSVVWRMLV